MWEGGGLDPRIPKIYNTWGLWWIVPEIWFWGFGGPWGAMGGQDDKVMVQVVGGEKMFLVYCWSSLILEVPLEAGGGWGLY